MLNYSDPYRALPGILARFGPALILVCFPLLMLAQEGRVQNQIRHGPHGFEFISADSSNLLQLQIRGQFRAAYPTDSDPVDLNDFEADRVYLKINRARLKIGGHALRPYFKYYFEYELFASNLLDFRLMYEQLPFFKVKVGQWKVQYNRERITSSGAQQAMDRSLLNRPFNLDRQQGISFYGRLGAGGGLDLNYWLSVFMGTGRGATLNDDRHLMYMMRMQWNILDGPIPFSGSDLGISERPALNLALAGVTNRSPYTRFSQAGGGQLEGFEEGLPGQYRVNQALLETTFKYRGWGVQQELHWKEINDLIHATRTELLGIFLQAGYFLRQASLFFPNDLEAFARYSLFDPDIEADGDLQEEITFGFNYFLMGHLNKLTLEFSFFDFQVSQDQLQEGSRVRFQWDVSF